MIDCDRLNAAWDDGCGYGIKQCAAGPWIDGPPPKDEQAYLGYWGPNDVGMTSWNPVVKQWSVEDRYTDKDPVKHAVIHMPKEKEEQMIHAREDYNRIQDPEKKIPDDEPVFLLRGQDRLAPQLVDDWATSLEKITGKNELTLAARGQANAMRRWQREHKSKTPDL